MTFQRSAIEERLKKLREVLRHLGPLRAVPKERFVSDYQIYWLAERGLQLAAEAVLDIANHILAAEFARYPETNEEALDALRSCRVISEGLREKLKGFGGLRNILVHGYLAIDEGQVYAHLQKAPEDLMQFIAEIIAWIEGRAESAAE